MVVERYLFTCPCVDYNLIPSLTEQEALLISLRHMDNNKKYVYGRVKTDLIGEKYVELVIGNDLLWHKFVFKKGFRLKETEERQFQELSQSPQLFMDMDDFVYFAEEINDYFTELGMPHMEMSGVGAYIRKLYYVLHESGPRELLYKCNLDWIADNLDLFEDINWLGYSPETIIGLPHKLLCILNTPSLVINLITEADRLEQLKVYKRFCSIIPREGITNYQWSYLCYVHKGLTPMNKKLFKVMKNIQLDKNFHMYLDYMKLASKLVEFSSYIKRIPEEEDLYDAIYELRNIEIILGNRDSLNKKISTHNGEKKYEYSDMSYEVMSPDCVEALIKEANSQRNCLVTYINDVAEGKTNIVFIRKSNNPNKSYVTVEIKEGEILQARAKNNMNPTAEVLRFMEGFAKKFGLIFNPFTFLELDFVEDCSRELQEYLNDFVQGAN